MTAHQEKSQTVKKLSLETNTEIPPVSTACGGGGPLGLCARVRDLPIVGNIAVVV